MEKLFAGDGEVKVDADVIDLETRLSVIQALIPLGLEAVTDVLQQEVEQLAGGRLHGANDGALLVAPHQPRQPNSVHPSERPLHALHDSGRREQTPLRQSTPPLAGVAFDRSGADPKPCADPGFFAFRVHVKARHGR